VVEGVEEEGVEEEEEEAVCYMGATNIIEYCPVIKLFILCHNWC
jgi:hypothetical protein